MTLPENGRKLGRRSVANADNLEKALRKVAKLVDAYGDEYWPTFVRLERELQAYRKKERRINKYLE